MTARKLFKLVLLLLFAGSIISLFAFYDTSKLTSIEMIRKEIEMFGVFAPIAFILTYALFTALFLPGTPLSIAGGALFGTLYGSLYTILGATLGATIAFYISRFLGKEFVDRFLKNRFEKIFKYDKKLAENGFSVVTLLRLIPLFPFNGLNFALGLTCVKPGDYILGTLIGIIPGVFVLNYFGNSLAMLMPLQIAIATVLLILLFLAVPMYKKFNGGKSFLDD